MTSRFYQKLILFAQFLVALFRPRVDIALENLALRQQVAVLKKERPRPRLTGFDRFFWVMLKRHWSRWKEPLIIVKPETVVGWHRKRFKLHWTSISRKGRKRGRPRIDQELREIIRRIALENPRWGSPRVHGELLKLAYSVCERTVHVARYIT